MADTPTPEWMKQWQALSRQGMAAWQEMARGDAAQPMPTATAWPGFEQAAQLFSAPAGVQGESAERLVEGARNYIAFMQSMLAASAGNAQGGVGPSWMEAWREGLAAMGGEAGLFEHPAARAWRTMPAQGSDGFAQLLGAWNAMRSPPPQGADIKQWLNLPAFGLLREHQEHYQKTATAFVDYQEQMRRYNALMLDATQRGLTRFETRLAEHEEPGRQIDSMRALYDLWVDAAEEGYAEVALSPEFRQVYGALVNAQMRVRSQLQQEVERISTDLGMPTRSEINGMGERLQALRREVRERGNDEVSAALTRLQAEFAAFRKSAARPHVASDSADDSSTASVPRKTKARGAAVRTARLAPASKPAAPAKKRRAAKPASRAAKSVAASAGNFSTRIEKFAGALGKARTTTSKKPRLPKNKKY